MHTCCKYTQEAVSGRQKFFVYGSYMCSSVGEENRRGVSDTVLWIFRRRGRHILFKRARKRTQSGQRSCGRAFLQLLSSKKLYGSSRNRSESSYKNSSYASINPLFAQAFECCTSYFFLFGYYYKISLIYRNVVYPLTSNSKRHLWFFPTNFPLVTKLRLVTFRDGFS